VLVAIVNHERTDAALALGRAFGAAAEVVLIDSGSRLSRQQARGFDLALPNVYYAGLLNAAVALAAARGAAHLYLVCSDVLFPDCALAVRRAEAALDDPHIGVYAPSARGSPHVRMRRRPGGRLRPVAFVDGFAFAARRELLERLCPIDTRLNALGYGLDVQLGYLAMRHGLASVVDDALTVEHPVGSGYSRDQARDQWRRWRRTELTAPARLFHRLVGLGATDFAPGLAAARMLARSDRART
jgi:GT2 family glycosyltransferase